MAASGKTQTDSDLVFPVQSCQVKCIDCGYVSRERGEAPNIQGPNNNPNALKPRQ